MHNGVERTFSITVHYYFRLKSINIRYAVSHLRIAETTKSNVSMYRINLLLRVID